MLTPQQHVELHDALQTRLQQLAMDIHDELLDSDEQTYIELAGEVHDLEEASLADLLVDVQLAEIDRHLHEVRDIEAALDRMREGRYGTCSDCGDAIALERLTAQPTALRCQPCQSAFERTHKHDRNATL